MTRKSIKTRAQIKRRRRDQNSSWRACPRRCCGRCYGGGYGYGRAGSGLGQGSRGDRGEEVQFPHEEKGREKSGF